MNFDTLLSPVAEANWPANAVECVGLLNHWGKPLDPPENRDFAAPFHFGDAKVVLLGEATHGTSEFYRARAAITRTLIEKHGFSIVAVEADSGAMGGSASQEFMVYTDAGEDLIASSASGYAANVEKATSRLAVVTDRVGEAIGTIEVGIRRVSKRAIGIDDRYPVTGLRAQHIRETTAGCRRVIRRQAIRQRSVFVDGE